MQDTYETVNYVLLSLTSMLNSSIGAGLASMTSRRQIQDGGPHDFRSKMAAPVTRLVTPRRVSQRPRPRESSVTS